MPKPPITAAQLAALPPDFQALLRAVIAHYEARIAALEARIAELEGGRGPPQNSSLPPSTQHPHAKPTPQKPKSKKKRGGQVGHKKHERPLRPTDACDDVQSLKPSECRRCGVKLVGKDSQPLRHQVWELPEIQPRVTEYQLHRLTCCCGTTTCAALPPGVPQGQSGPRLIAFTALLMAYYRQSKRRTAEFLTTLLGVPCCAATTVKMQHQATAAVRSAYDELLAQLPLQEHVSADETPSKEGPAKVWLWTFVAKRFTTFALRDSREATAIDERYLLRGLQSGQKQLVGTCRELYQHRAWLWEFTRTENVEPTNNASERALRHAVIWRKLSFGTQSATGSRFVETMLTVIETCRQQGRRACDYLTSALQAHFAKQKIPSLLFNE